MCFRVATAQVPSERPLAIETYELLSLEFLEKSLRNPSLIAFVGSVDLVNPVCLSPFFGDPCFCTPEIPVVVVIAVVSGNPALNSLFVVV